MLESNDITLYVELFTHRRVNWGWGSYNLDFVELIFKGCNAFSTEKLDGGVRVLEMALETFV